MKPKGDDDFDIDNLLDQDLWRTVGTLRGPSPQVDQSAYQAAFLAGEYPPPVSSSLNRIVSTKAGAAALAITAIVVGGGSAAAAMSIGGPNPTLWGKTVTTVVTNCRDQLRADQHGIGDCVSAIARQNGEVNRTVHSPGAGPQNPPQGASASQSHAGNSSSGRAYNHPTGPPNGVSDGRSTSPPTGPPNGVSGGRFKSQPTGPPEGTSGGQSKSHSSKNNGHPNGASTSHPGTIAGPGGSGGSHGTGPPVSPPPRR
ncbi:MAG: hypothetical protein M3256_02325 [Actinomycetota bacterium]|nr:hypothetical protein [Actinomycetota bacterium]